MQKKPKTIKVTVENVGPIHRVELPLKPGVNVLTGENGAGKTSALNASARLFGAEAPVEVRDGADHGMVEGGGVRLVVRKVVRATGAADVALADVGALAQLIEPGLKDTTAAAKARIRALLSLSRLPVTDEAIERLAEDEAVATAALEAVREEGITDLVQASERVRTLAHTMKGRAEEEAALVAGQAKALDMQAEKALADLGGRALLIDTAPEEAEAAARRAAAEETQGRLLARQRTELEAQQAEIRASLGEPPDPSRFDARIAELVAAEKAARDVCDELKTDVDRCREALREAERKYQRAKVEAGNAEAAVEDERAAKDAEVERLKRHQAQHAVLSREITGPTAADVEALTRRANDAAGLAARARLSDSYRVAHVAAAACHQRANELADRAHLLETVATTVRDRLGALLAGTALEGLTIVDGRLAVVAPDGALLDFETRQSEGQRARIAFRVASRVFAGRVVPLSGRLWATWDPTRKEEVSRIAAEEGMYVITEEPTVDPTLGVEHFPVESAAA